MNLFVGGWRDRGNRGWELKCTLIMMKNKQNEKKKKNSCYEERNLKTDL